MDSNALLLIITNKEFRAKAHANHVSYAPVDDRLDELLASVIGC